MKKVFTVVVCLLMFMSASNIVSASTFEQGDEGQEIVVIQSKLASLGYDVSADGDFGNQTVLAVKAFQAERGLEVDGVVGAQTYRLLVGRDIPQVSRDSSSTGSIKRLISIAGRYKGVPYVFGGTSPGGFDCSGYMRYIYAQVGVNLPRMADEQYAAGQPVSYGRLKPGDMVFFSTYEPGISHSGMYIGNGQFISATSSRGVAVDSLDSSYWGPRYVGACRVL